MAIVFLSHSSYDNVAAAEIKKALLANGYESVFLDIDEDVGIHPGSHWREELARRLRTSDAVVYLGSSRSERSVWCTAELAVAKTLEKLILPLQLEKDARHELLDEEQWVMFTSTTDDAIVRLLDELEQSSDSSAHRRSWDDRRSPFPGLRPFSEGDAGVFFGRDTAIDELVRMVDPVSLLDHRSLVVVVGASGAGKSSLVRAGLIPILTSHRPHRREVARGAAGRARPRHLPRAGPIAGAGWSRTFGRRFDRAWGCSVGRRGRDPVAHQGPSR